jgi:hypothetical protein
MPKSDDKNVGYKYPFNATEILCCDNNAVMERIMHELRMGGDDSDDSEDGKEEGEKIRKIMRYGGPRMLWHHPLMALKHIFIEWRTRHGLRDREAITSKTAKTKKP